LLTNHPFKNMDDAAPIRASAPYEAELERTMQALNERKRELEYALHQVCFKAMPFRKIRSFAK
jgi:hypothetical protein